MEAKTRLPLQEDRFSIVERVARIVSSVRGTKPDYAHLASELAPVLPFDLFGIVLLRHDRQAVRVTACTHETGGWVSHYHQHPLADSMLERILQTTTAAKTAPSSLPLSPEAPLSLDDTSEMVIHTYPGGLDGTPRECGDALSGNPYLRAALIAPLAVGDHVLGTLELGSVDINAYTDESQLRVIHAVVRVLAAAIESAQVGGSVEIQDRQRRELQKVSSALTSEMDLATILHRIVDGIAKALNVASAIIMIDRHSGKLCLDAQQGLNPDLLQKVVSRKTSLSDASITGATLRRRQSMVSNDIAQDEHFPASQALATELGMRSVFSYPLVIGSTVFGTLLLLSPEPGGFTPLKTDILSLFASQAMIAIHNGMLLESVRERQRFQDAIEQLEKVHRQVADEEDEQALLKTLHEETERTFGISFSSLLRFISDHLLTHSEQDLQSIIHTLDDWDEATPVPADGFVESVGVPGTSYGQASNLPANADRPAREKGATALARTAEAALARAGLLGDVGAALTAALDPTRIIEKGSSSAIPHLYERVTRDMQDPWFIVDLQGQCIYVNSAAEALCGMRLELGKQFFGVDSAAVLQRTQALRLQDVLARLLPRIRNRGEVLSYLQEFMRPDIIERRSVEALQLVRDNQERFPHLNPLPANTLRCVVAAEPIRGEASNSPQLSLESQPRPGRSRALLLDNAPSDRHYQFMRYALYDQDNELIAHALQIHDITEQVRDERNKSALLSSVSHDLRTPLTAIKAAVSGLLQPGVRWDEKMRREMLEDIDAEADHLHAMINSMVEMSRIEMGALVLEKEWCDLVEIVHSTLSRIGRALAGYHIRTDFEPQLPLIHVDYLQLKRVFANLLENAARHSHRNEDILITAHTVSLDTSAETPLEGGPRYVRVSVVDHGSGVPQEERERIFKSFYSLDGHTGLGLAICRGIIEAHQGRIWVEPALVGGACFVFVLPVSS